ncbi:MAG TPA: (2Fe-2S) ferredoxin domain-containing protein [Candidatus Merdivicinus faecavium]|nr:(2Fe-2S) ferredoxin domain-containing protein [Candidatus Merdivicinus faecavium]
MDIYVCVGSSCHLKGSYNIIHVFQELIDQYNLKDQVELKASFCLGRCTDGVATKINGEFVDHVSPENAVEVFHEHVLKPLGVE